MKPAHLLASLLLCACTDRPDPAAMAAWRKEAQEANARRTSEAAVPSDAGAEWNLRVEGQVARPFDVGLSEMQRGETTAFHAKGDFSQRSDFRGPRISVLINRAGPSPEATTVTAVGKDGYFATFDLVDIRAHLIIVAFEEDGKPFSTAKGGPIAVRFDLPLLAPELQRRYQNNHVLYVTHLIVGDERAHLRIGARVLDDAALDQLPEESRTGPVSYRSGWASTPQILWGVRLADAIGTAPFETARVLGKDELHHETGSTPLFRAADLARCEPLIVRRYGADRRKVPSRMGGPLLLAVKPVCRDTFERSGWLWFVESVELAP